MVKVGYTTGPIQQRLSQLQVSNPNELQVCMLFETPNFVKMEKQAHLLLWKRRVRGEWFVLEEGFNYERFLAECAFQLFQ